MAASTDSIQIFTRCVDSLICRHFDLIGVLGRESVFVFAGYLAGSRVGCGQIYTPPGAHDSISLISKTSDTISGIGFDIYPVNDS